MSSEGKKNENDEMKIQKSMQKSMYARQSKFVHGKNRDTEFRIQTRIFLYGTL